MTMRARSILNIGIIVLTSIYSACPVEVAVGRRRNRRSIQHKRDHRNANKIFSSGEYEGGLARNLGVGLDDLQYRDSRGQYHIEVVRGKDGKGKSKGTSNSENIRGKGKGSFPSYGKGSGKGYSNLGSMDSEDMPYSPSSGPPHLTPTISSKSGQPTIQKNTTKGKDSKLRKSEKVSPTKRPVLQPTKVPTIDQPTPSPSFIPTDEPNTIPTSASGDILVSLTPYTILYTITEDERPPFRSELLEVVELTRIYIDRYFSSIYQKSDLTNLSEVMTIFTNTEFEFGEAIPIEFESKAEFKSSTVFVPEKGDLDSILQSAFEGDTLDGYIGMIQSLPPSNMFSSIQHVELVQMFEESQIKESEKTIGNITAKSMTLGAIAVGGAAGLVLIFAISRRFSGRPQQSGDKSIFGNKSSDTSGAETFATRGTRQDDRMFRSICDELYDGAIENRR